MLPTHTALLRTHIMPKKPVGNTFLKKVPLPTLFEQSAMKGQLCTLDKELLSANEPQPFYTHPNGSLILGDSLRWLASLEPESIDLINDAGVM
jgi:restriction endonuclease S subunit